MKYQFKRIMLLTILTTIFLSACQPAKNEMDSLEQYRTEYIGDNNNVIKIASLQDYPTGYTYDHIEIRSDEEPYELIIYLKVTEMPESDYLDLEENSNSIFDLIANLGKITFVNEETQKEIVSYNKE
ncbi:TPA: DUF4825 domain-containing protein [Streptococcus suis]|uniref:DUF4825 domain-containing protein n=1 Tax=Streptococcus suis TaxID=1307 RepID=A0A9X4MJB1_STRSU|nr:DUF4825 domain-containing protein [Streptococcus parasuis]MDG4511367.1 DUF4825 domain-containing protein [Streptococcus suis]QWV87093.1 DUF4825 domain-containing protein [Streptococcus parasuis]HEM3597083.1 DUF4825 domain-containing protein [Streptococcus suis]HEM3607224.1 DUF4825 domain-containing protein [Streptococcus suis]HEM3616830.1 DUF4825 domain-containing protein [Streptococcus suis]